MKPLVNIGYKELGEYFGYFSKSFEFYRLVEKVFDRVDWPATEDELVEAIDSALIYNEDCWTLAMAYVCNPNELDWDEVLSDFTEDIINIAYGNGGLRDE